MKLGYKFYGIFFTLSFVANLIIYLTWKSWNNRDLGEYWWFVSFFEIILTGLVIARQYFKPISFTFFLIADFFFNLSVTKLITELLYDGTEWNKTELLGLGVGLLITGYRYLRYKKKI